METNKLLFEAIALRKCVVATYNRTVVTLAPHILYTRHDDIFADGVVVARDGQPPREIKLGTFKLSGLKDLALTERPFTPSTLFKPLDAKYEGTTLFAVEMS